MKGSKCEEVLFTRSTSIAKVIERSLRAATVSVDAALYRLEHPKLVRALNDAAGRGLRVRVVLDRGKYEMTRETRELLQNVRFSYRVLSGRRGSESKMHHKFAVLDGRLALAGSFNWTAESEKQNYENLLILPSAPTVKRYLGEFESLWTAPKKRRSGGVFITPK